jgi:hypothetical protein
MDKKGTLASVATALASNVFPQPGGPSKSAPFGTYEHTIKINDSKHCNKINTEVTLIRKPINQRQNIILGNVKSIVT